MRKNFLILMLLSLLPLAGWAADDISTATVTLNRTQLDYTGKATAPSITAAAIGETDILSAIGSTIDIKFYTKAADGTYTETAAVRNAGDYALSLVPVSGKDTYTGESPKFDFTILPGTLHITLKDAEKVYGDPDPTQLEYTWDDQSELKGDDDVNNTVLTFKTLTRDTEAATKELVNATHQYTSVVVTTDNYTVEISNSTLPKLVISKAELTATIGDGSPVKIFYGEANPTLNTTTVNFSGWKMSETDKQKAAILADANFNYTQNETNANADKDGELLSGITTGYTMTFTGFNLDNYEVKMPSTQTMYIKQIELAAAPAKTPDDGKNYFVYTADANAITYNGTKQTPAPTIKYFDRQGVEHILAMGDKKDYTMSYAGGEEATRSINAGTYTATVNAVAGSNYSGTLAVSALNYTIGKKDLYVYVQSDEKKYDGTSFSNPKFEYNTLAAKDNTETFKKAITGVSLAYKKVNGKDVTDIQKKSVGSYTVYPVIADGEGSNLNTNYTPIALENGKYTIKARPVTVTAKAQTIKYGGSIDDTVTDQVDIQAKDEDKSEGILNDTDKGILQGMIELSLIDGSYPVKDTAYEKVIKVAEKSSLTNDQKALKANYSFNYVGGNLTVTGSEYTLIAQNKSITYGDKYALTDFTAISTAEDPAKTVTFEVYNSDGSQKLNTLPTDQGTYTIKIVKDDAYKPNANYSSINYVDGSLTIAKKVVTVVASDVTVNKGATEADLNTLGASSVTFTGKLANDVIAYKLEYVKTATDKTDSSTKLFDDDDTMQEGEFAGGYKIVALPDAEKKAGVTYANDNYQFKFSTGDAQDKVEDASAVGKLIVAGADALTINAQADAADIANILTVADGKTYDLTITNHRTLRGGKWYTMVLPFDITVAKLSAAMKPAATTDEPNPVGYAIVNTLSDTSTSDDIVFNLWMSNLNANEPFLIKTAVDIDLAKVKINGKISKVKIDDPSVTAGTVKFTGLYGTKADLSNTERSIIKDEWYTNHTGINLRAFEAYLSGCSAKARIFIEDIDENGTTAIKELNAQTMTATTVDGWYTLNGIRLAGAPTEKGVYINNGKKVVIK
ncbi:MAG: hypothetical protein IJ588_02990 [Prevotella sp.]|nr:hypothetical protein [Prevotella sp.]